MIADTIATGLVLIALAWGLYATKHATEHPEWFEEDVMWQDLDNENKKGVNDES